MWRKGISLPLIIFLVILLLSAGMILFLAKFKPANLDFQDANRKVSNEALTPSPESAKQSTAKSTSECDASYVDESQIVGWKTYQNHKQEFEIQVPAEMHHTAVNCSQGGWALETNDSNDGSLMFSVEDVAEFKKRLGDSNDIKRIVDKAPETYKSALADFLGSTDANDILLSSERLLSLYSSVEASYPLTESHKFLTINGYPAIKYVYTSEGGRHEIKTFTQTRYAILADNKIYTFHRGGISNPPEDLLDNIVKSFNRLPQ